MKQGNLPYLVMHKTTSKIKPEKQYFYWTIRFAEYGRINSDNKTQFDWTEMKANRNLKTSFPVSCRSK